MRKAVQHLKQSDPVLRAIMERVGAFKMNYDEPQFASLAEAIVYQQLHGKAAATIFKRLTDLTGLPLTPEGILRLSEQQMRGAGLSKQKLSYLRDLAAKTQSGELDFARLPEMPDEEVIKHSDIGQRNRGLDGAHVFDVLAAASQCVAYGRLRYPGRDSQTLSQTQDAQTGADGENREMLGTV